MRIPASGPLREATPASSALLLLGFVFLLAIAFWAGAAWIGQTLIQLTAA